MSRSEGFGFSNRDVECLPATLSVGNHRSRSVESNRSSLEIGVSKTTQLSEQSSTPDTISQARYEIQNMMLIFVIREQILHHGQQKPPRPNKPQERSAHVEAQMPRQKCTCDMCEPLFYKSFWHCKAAPISTSSSRRTRPRTNSAMTSTSYSSSPPECRCNASRCTSRATQSRTLTSLCKT
ncbi:hypothetical protein EJ02DRAFT_84093 [Clathrospora elynae]|uniref:Uncharacterized protein n=1 Tax=Clathrospora elynae TaxID=706981 RepID=A0A6A5T6D0_9PLEO|nr:hypothetical protein EJ02DRAFT_84093 [Clathrospora elynae]